MIPNQPHKRNSNRSWFIDEEKKTESEMGKVEKTLKDDER